MCGVVHAKVEIAIAHSLVLIITHCLPQLIAVYTVFLLICHNGNKAAATKAGS